MFRVRTGALDVAMAHGHRALEVYRRLGERSFERVQLIYLAWVNAARSNYPATLDHGEQALALGFGHADAEQNTRAVLLRYLGYALSSLDRFDEARESLTEALAVDRALGDRRCEVHTLLELGSLCDRAGDHHQACEYFELARAIGREMGTDKIEAQLYELGHSYWFVDRRDDAYATTWRALGLSRELGLWMSETASLNVLGTLHRLDDKPAEAVEHHRDALTVAENIGDHAEQALAHVGLGDAHADLGDQDTARAHWRRALDAYRELGMPAADRVAARLRG